MKKTLKRLLSSCLVVVMLLTVAPLSGFVGLKLNLDWLNFDWIDFRPRAIAATSGTCGDNLTWTFDKATGELIISGTGTMSDFSNYAPWDSYCSLIKKVTLINGVTNIGIGAFANCTNLAKIIVPNSITVIGNSAFYDCSSLTSVEFSDGVTTIGNNAFSGCGSLTSITIPDSVISIGDFAFSNCTNLTSITIGKNVASIGCDAFNNTKYFNTKSNWENNVLYIGNNLIISDRSLSGEYIIKGGTKLIAERAFYYCKKLTNITIPDSVTTIGDWSFYECNNLKSVLIPDSVTIIGDYAFNNCYELTSITIPDSVTTIGDSAFRNCDRLANVIIGNGVKTIGNSAFYSCSNLANVIIGNGVKTIGNSAFYSCSNLTNVTIPDSVTRIGISVFEFCSSLTSAAIGKGVTSIDNSAFKDCVALTSITIPNSVTTIGYGAFQYCTNLTNLIIGKNVTSIQSSAFYNCSSLICVKIPDNVASIQSSAFSGCIGLKELVMPISTEIYSAFSGCKNIEKITLTKGNGTVQNYTSSTGASDTYYQYTPWYISQCPTIIIEDGVTAIGNFMFSNCSNIVDFLMPDSVTTIGAGAFSNCINLKNIIIPDGVTDIGDSAFSNCDRLISAKISDTVISIGNSAFIDCDNIISIIIPDSVTSIGKNAFYNCGALTEVTIGNSVVNIGEWAFAYCDNLVNVIIGNSVVNIGEWTFYECNNLIDVHYGGGVSGWCSISFGNSYSNPMNYGKNLYINRKLLEIVVIPSGFTVVNDFVFQNCTSLKSVIIPDSVTDIGASAFKNCSSLTSIIIPDSVTSIGTTAFYNCVGLTELTMPISAKICNDSSYTFSGCTNIKKITLTQGNGTVQDYATSKGESDTYYQYTPWHISQCPTIIIEDGVTQIGSSTFYRCVDITKITIPDSVTSIGSLAFANCTNLTSITIPDSVTSLGRSAFSNCTSLLDIRIPGSIRTIGAYTFENCTSLKSVLLGTGITTVDSAFLGCRSIESFTIPATVQNFNASGTSPTYIYYGGSAVEWQSMSKYIPENKNRVIYYNCSIPSVNDKISISKDFYTCFVGGSFYISGDICAVDDVGSISLSWISEDGVEIHTPASIINSSKYNASFSVQAKGIKSGLYSVRVKGSNGLSDSCSVKVVEPKSELKVSVKNTVDGGYYCINNKLVDHNLNELDSVSYKITVENKLSIDSTGVPLTDEIKEQLTIDNISISAGLSDYSSLSIDIADITELKSVGTLAPGEKKVYTLNIYPLKLENKEISAEINMTATATDKKDISINTPVVIKNKLYTPQAIVSFYVDSEVTYNDGKYSKDSLPVTLRITNRIPSDFKGDISKINDLPEYQIKLTGASVSVLESDLIKKSDISHTITNDTLKPGQSLTLEGTITINTKHKISELIEEEYVGIEYKVQTSANSPKGNKVITFVNKDFKESSDELSKKAQEELEKLKKKGLAGVAFNPFIMNYLNVEECKQLEDLLLTQIILQTLPEESLEEKVKNKLEDIASDDIMDAIESVDKEVAKYVNTLKGLQEITPSVTKETIKSKITIQTSEGPVTVYFDGTLDKYDYNDRNFANMTNSIKYRIEGDHIPENSAGTSGTVDATLAKVDEFSKAAEEVAVDAIIDACTEFYGPAINMAQDVLFGRPTDKIVNKAAKIAWVIATSPSKVVSADCPVDIFVYDENGNLCASVESDVITLSCEKATFEISASKKSVRLFDENYTVKFIPTGNATMNVTVEEYANSFSVLKTYEFTDVPISYGGVYTQSVNTEYMSKDNSYALTLEDGTVVNPDTVTDNFHYHTVEKYETVTEATCTSAEVVCGECTVCQKLVYDTVSEPVDCTPGEWVVVKEATCAQVGEKQTKCIYCDDMLETEEISLLPHTEGEWIITVQPTQTSEGKKEQKCTVCGKTLKQENVDKLPTGKVHSVAIDNFTMEYKDSATITPNINIDTGVKYTVSYSSSDSSVVQIDENGNITTRDKGSATITVTVTDEHGNTVTDTCEVTVKYKWWQWIIVIVLFGWIWY